MATEKKPAERKKPTEPSLVTNVGRPTLKTNSDTTTFHQRGFKGRGKKGDKDVGPAVVLKRNVGMPNGDVAHEDDAFDPIAEKMTRSHLEVLLAKKRIEVDRSEIGGLMKKMMDTSKLVTKDEKDEKDKRSAPNPLDNLAKRLGDGDGDKGTEGNAGGGDGSQE